MVVGDPYTGTETIPLVIRESLIETVIVKEDVTEEGIVEKENVDPPFSVVGVMKGSDEEAIVKSDAKAVTPPELLDT